MKTLLKMLAVALLIPVPALAQYGEPFQEEGGLIVMEMESSDYQGTNWNLKSDEGAGNGTYLEWEGGDYFFSPGPAETGHVYFPILVTDGGEYNVRFHSRRFGGAPDLNNDVWFAKDINESFEKIYSNGNFNFRWGWNTVNEEANHSDERITLSPGEHVLVLSGRSNGFQIDRIVLYRDNVADPLNLSNPESPRGPQVDNEFEIVEDPNGFSLIQLPSLGDVGGQFVQGEGYKLGPVLDPGVVSFASVEKLHDELELRPNQLYEIKFFIRSSTNNRPTNPVIRTRVNDSSFQSSKVFAVEPILGRNAEMTPATDDLKEYRTFYWVDPLLADTELLLAVDYLYLPGLGMDPNVILTIERVEVNLVENNYQ